VGAGELDAAVQAFAEERFVELEAEEPDPDKPARVLYNDRFYLKLHTAVFAGQDPFARAVPARPYGRNAVRLAAEDALLAHVLHMARRAFALPLIYYVDLREMVLGAVPEALGHGPGAPLDAELLAARAREVGAEKALWAALELLAYFHPEVEPRARALQPNLSRPTRLLLETAVLGPARDFGRERQLRGAAKVAEMLLG
jgi:hypothetical protein